MASTGCLNLFTVHNVTVKCLCPDKSSLDFCVHHDMILCSRQDVKTSIINELTQFPFIWTHTGLISVTFVPRNQSLSPWFSELRTCVKVKVAVLGSPPLISSMVFVDVKQH